MNLAEKMEVAQALLALGVDVHRGRLPHRLARRFRGRERDRPLGPRRADLRPGPLPRRGHRPGLGGRPARRAAADPRFPRHQRHPSRVQAQDGQGGHHPPCRGRRAAGGGLLPQRRVLARGRRPHRDRFPLPGGRSGHRRRRHDGQHSRHGGLRHAQPHAPRDPDAPQPRAQHRQGRDQRPLPQRPGHGRGQQPGRRRGGRRADRVHDQRPGRAGRQLLAGRGRDGPADPQRLTIMPTRTSTPGGWCPPAGWWPT